MRKYNIFRPILLLAVAFFVKTLTTTICLLLGAEQETASNIGFIAMLIAAVLTFQRMNRRANKPKK